MAVHERDRPSNLIGGQVGCSLAFGHKDRRIVRG